MGFEVLTKSKFKHNNKLFSKYIDNISLTSYLRNQLNAANSKNNRLEQRIKELENKKKRNISNFFKR